MAEFNAIPGETIHKGTITAGDVTGITMSSSVDGTAKVTTDDSDGENVAP
jgi:hypothetical protein